MKPQRKTLTRVEIGPDRTFSELGVTSSSGSAISTPVVVTFENLHDERMGMVRRPGFPTCEADHAACFGRMGVIAPSVYFLNPAAQTVMIQYLRLFTYVSDNEGPRLVLKPGVASLVERHRTLSGSRRLKAISDDTGGSEWKVWTQGGGVQYTKGKQHAEISGTDLKELLSDATARYSGTANVTLQDIGINTEISKPEDFILGGVPVLPNTMRIPSVGRGGSKGVEDHPYTQYYKEILGAVATGNIARMYEEYGRLISGGEQNTLKSDVFHSDKRAFIRGRMFAKVGGQIARSVATPNTHLRPDQVGIPRHLAREISRRLPVTTENMQEVVELINEGHVNYIFRLDTLVYIRIDAEKSPTLIPGKTLVLRELTDGDVVLVNRQPTLHKNSILAFYVVLHDRDTIEAHPSVSTGFGLDFDGRFFAVNRWLLMLL